MVYSEFQDNQVYRGKPLIIKKTKHKLFPPETGFLYIVLIGLEFTETIYLPLLPGKFFLSLF